MVQVIVAVVASILSATVHDLIFLVWFLYFLATLLPSLSVSVRRLHDAGRSAWWLLAGTVPPLIAIPVMVIGVYLIGIGITGSLLGALFVGPIEAVSGGGGTAESLVEESWGLFLVGFTLAGIGAFGMIAAAIFAVVLIVRLASPGELGCNKYGPQTTNNSWTGRTPPGPAPTE